MDRETVVDYFRAGTDDTVWVIPELVQQDMYRIEQLAAEVRQCKGVVLDCGAHIGVFACLLAKHGVANPIHAFEPEPSNYRYLVMNAQRYSNIMPINKAVGTGDCVMELHDGGDTGRWSFCPKDGGSSSSCRVEVIDLGNYIRSMREVALLKMDMEGYEADVLNGMPDDALRRVRLLVTEEHHRPIDTERLRALGFSLWYRPRGCPRHAVYRLAAQPG